MFTDYKFWFIRRDDNGYITEVAVRFYEGEYQIIDGKQVYNRTKRLHEKDLTHLGEKKVMKEKNDFDCIVYTEKDFGNISTDDELRTFCNQEIAKDIGREVINEQKIWQP